MNLVIDDSKDYGGDIIARNPIAGKTILKNLLNITTLYIDFDLGGSETGADIVQWALQNSCLPRRVQIISTSPSGRKAIENILLNAGYQKEDNYYILIHLF